MKRRTIAKAALGALIVAFGLPCDMQLRVEAQGTPENAASPPNPAETKKVKTKLRVAVIAGNPPEPVQGARVELTWEENKDEPNIVKMTDKKGAADMEVARGKVLIQVIANAQHWRSNGLRCILQKETESVRITLVKDNTPPVDTVKTCESYMPNHDN
jgi:hypothetical protein